MPKSKIKFKTVQIPESTHKKLMDCSEKAGISNGALIDAMLEFCREQDLIVIKGFRVLAKFPKQEPEKKVKE
jgi:hypothetical protein